ncbi:MAG: type II toxin-antitoxin system HicA family toxin [Nitrospirales bacterium]
MKLPRDLSAEDLIQKLKHLGYQVTRQTGSHVRLTSTQQGEHHITIPNHNPLRVGTLSTILTDIAEHFSITREQCIQKLFT